MNRLALDFTKRAEEKAKAAAVMFDASDFGMDAKKQAQFVVGKVTANVMFLLAEMLEVESGSTTIDEKQAHRKAIMDSMDAVRAAAAKGDWDEWERLVEGFTPRSDAGSD